MRFGEEAKLSAGLYPRCKICGIIHCHEHIKNSGVQETCRRRMRRGRHIRRMRGRRTPTGLVGDVPRVIPVARPGWIVLRVRVERAHLARVARRRRRAAADGRPFGLQALHLPGRTPHAVLVLPRGRRTPLRDDARQGRPRGIRKTGDVPFRGHDAPRILPRREVRRRSRPPRLLRPRRRRRASQGIPRRVGPGRRTRRGKAPLQRARARPRDLPRRLERPLRRARLRRLAGVPQVPRLVLD